ncbi:uncharacterized protein B0H18DRAFT_981998 [Fomitopsis serialis]|uniref:uncharacterized protein n=1 Tax=Fomitopsis serialis TaxID=139415 RepID=UPI00200850AA|nr:uncharacterized protein B0H18DRAFT_981998 [Neoantrodia serialis]KAH9933787.1 hypothetical protein B0H18DRAFT_981998 [Neoantrodia serialis]
MPSSDILSGRLELLGSLHGSSLKTMFSLLVLVSGLLSQEHYAHLTTFLAMQCAEKAPDQIVRVIEHDLSHQDPEVRLSAIKKVEVIASWRSHLLALDVILDRTYRRPFKVTRPPVPFVPTDMGSSLFVLDEDVYEFKDNHGHVLPLELRRRLAEIGWDEEDRTIDPKTQWIKTPMSLLPSLHLESLDAPLDDMASIGRSSSPGPSPDPSPTASPSKEGPRLRRQSSDSGTRGSKRRPIFVATTARNFILDLMRDDPSLLSRSPHLRHFVVMAFLHAQHSLPPAMAHHLLNHLAGFLKSSANQQARAHPLQGYAYAKMSVRELRRAKADTFLLPSGALWFAPSAPAGPMFPRGPDANQDPFESLPKPLVWITLIRTAQNMLFLRMLERDPQALKHIRKNLVRLELPSLDGDGLPGSLAFASFLPHKSRTRKPVNAILTALSLTLARSYLLLVAQIFWSMTRHLNDRQELAILVDGLNRVLLTHGDDIGIVGHALLAFMLASTRFKRMFISGGAYALFMPAIIKTYCEAEYHPGIRAAIEYAVNRFYALHQESFVFQSFDVVSRMFMSPDMDQPWLAKQVFALFSTLKNGTAPLAPDVAGIYDLTKLQEQENRMVAVAEEVPQTFLASLRKGGSGKRQVTLVLPEDYEWKRLGLDNLVRLFLTVIAHNPAIQRAERFMRSLRLLAPYLYNASTSSRTVLRDGIDALGAILVSRNAAKAKMPDTMQPRATDDFTYEVLVEGNSNEAQPALSPADIIAMRLDYLSLVVAFAQAGGELGPAAPGRVVELTKMVLKDSIISADRIAAFLTDYMKAVLLRDPTPSLKEALALLNDFVPLVSAYSTSVNFSGVFDVLASLCGNSVFANQPRFAQVVVAGYCRAGLEACEAAASESWLLSLPSRMSVIRLMNAAVTLVGADVLEELAKHSPSYDFLTGVNASELSAGNQWTESWHREAHSRAWARLLTYILSACQNPHVPREQAEDRRKSSDSRLSEASPKPAMSFTIALQILKIIVVRAEDDLSSLMPTCEWEPDVDNPFLPSIASRSWSGSQPRLIDYLYARVVQEKVALHVVGASPMSVRRFSVFTKPRRSMVNESAVSSAASTPRHSTFLNTSLSLPTFDESYLRASTPRKDEGSRLAGYARDVSPISPSGRTGRDSGPRIVHLGPVTPLSVYGGLHARRAASPSGASRGKAGTALDAAKERTVTSVVLVRATYRRIRLAQTVLGYSTVLPLGEGEEEDINEMQEVKDLMEEFREDYAGAGDDSLVMVDAEEPTSPSKW